MEIGTVLISTIKSGNIEVYENYSYDTDGSIIAQNNSTGIIGSTIEGGSIKVHDNSDWGINTSNISGGTVTAYKNQSEPGVGNSTITANALVVSYNNGASGNGTSGYGFFQDTITGGTVKTSSNSIGNMYGIYTSSISAGLIYACYNSTGIAGGSIFGGELNIENNKIGIDETTNPNYRVERVEIKGGTINLVDNTERSIKNYSLYKS